MHDDATSVPEQWYRNRYVWLVIAIPAATIAGSLVTIYLALANPDYLVDGPGADPLSSPRGVQHEVLSGEDGGG